MTNVETTVKDVLHEEGPVKKPRMISRLFETGMEVEEAAHTVSDVCEMDDGMVVGLKREVVKQNGSQETVDISNLDQKPGEPTGEYFTGRGVVHEDDYDGTPPGLPVLEDVSHPLVPELGHGYYPREMRGNKNDLEVVVRTLADPDYATLLIGETGVGKNVLLKKICEKCNWPMQRTNFGVGVDYESLIGRFAPRQGEHSGREMGEIARGLAEELDITMGEAIEIVASQSSSFEFIDGILKQCVENGFMFVGDEINTVGGETTSTLHGLTEEKSSRELVVQDTSEVIKPDKRFLFCGTMNPVDYTGTNRLNRAFQTRFYPVQIPYLNSDAEVEVVMEKSYLGEHDLGREIAEELVDLADRIRTQVRGEGGMQTAVSSRDLIKIGNTITDPDGSEFMDPKQATKMIMEGIAAPGDWNPISSTIDTQNFP